MLHTSRFWIATILLLTVLTSGAYAQVVEFRMQATDLAGTPTETVNVGETFLLNVTTQHANGYVSATNAGVFAAYLDVSYDAALASVAGDITHSTIYANGKSGDLTIPGLLDNIGGFSSSGDLGFGLDPIGLDEEFLFSVPFRADAEGALSFVGGESNSYPLHDVLVYGLDEAVRAQDVNFGTGNVRIRFGSLQLNVVSVPEPENLAIVGGALLPLLGWRRRMSM